jgi:hypothetical protein
MPDRLPCPPQSKSISQRRAAQRREKAPEPFLFPERILASPELLEFAARHGYEGEELKHSIESMRIKRLRDNKQYRDERELALDIQYWIMNCASNRDKHANANGGQW